MGVWINVRTEKELGPYLSKTFKSLVSGPEIDGLVCELNQLSVLLEINLKCLTIMNYSGLWDESSFPKDKELKKKLIEKQKKEDEIWNDIDEFEKIIENVLICFEENKSIEDHLNHKHEWWKGYFRFPTNEKSFKDSFINDLKKIQLFLKESKAKGEQKVVFYLE